MEVKGAVKFLRNHFKIGIYEKKSLDIITLLQQGEAYRQMWKCLKEQLTYSSDKENLRFKAKRFLYLMKCFEQKYFPKEEKENEESKIT